MQGVVVYSSAFTVAYPNLDSLLRQSRVHPDSLRLIVPMGAAWVGKQQLAKPRRGTNVLNVMFPHLNFLFDPYNDTLHINGAVRKISEYLGDLRPESSLDQLLRCIESGAEPEDNAQLSAQGVEVLMAAYRSLTDDGQAVALPLEDGANPLVQP